MRCRVIVNQTIMAALTSLVKITAWGTKTICRMEVKINLSDSRMLSLLTKSIRPHYVDILNNLDLVH